MEPNQFWNNDAAVHPALTDAALSEAQQALGVTLPESYVRLLRYKNGGSTQGFVFPTAFRTSWAEDHVPLDELFGIGDKNNSANGTSILDTEYMTREWGLPEKQVILSGDGHWWIALDYRLGKEPSVAWIERDTEAQLARTFDLFLASLLPESTVDEITCTLRK